MAIDEPIKTAKTILTFFDNHANYQVKLLSMTDIRVEESLITNMSPAVFL